MSQAFAVVGGRRTSCALVALATTSPRRAPMDEHFLQRVFAELVDANE
jgi:hypothetical protein